MSERSQPLRAPSGPMGAYSPWAELDRPRYREPLPVRPARVVLGMLVGAAWMALASSQVAKATFFCWSMFVAGIVAGSVAVLLSRIGDRGAAAGVAIAAALGVCVATLVVVVSWAHGNWLLW
jgi:hypothetical protein